MLKGACIFGQSGGPTSVINASAFGVFDEAIKNPNITRVLGAAHGIKGVLNDQLYDISFEAQGELERLPYTPSSALGSCRYKLADPDKDDTDYKRILEIFKKYDVRYFFYNGGNDSMDTCNKISKYMQKVGYECNVIGVPKTIDNDLFGTDHCPGFGSAAKYIATSGVKLVSRESSEAFYRPSTDTVVLPLIKQFDDTAEYYSTAFHELTHSTGHPKRLNRITETARFGSAPYSREELCAELGASFLLNRLGIETPGSFRNNAAYINHWLGVLKEDKRLLVSAAGQADKAVRLILGEETDSDVLEG